MNVFKIHQGYRRIGLNYGLPVWYIEFGVGVKYEAVDLVKKLVSMSLDRNNWVVIRNAMSERGVGTLVQTLNYIGVKTEVECTGKDVTPGWFTFADRWLVDWTTNSVFNYMAMRPRQDMLLCRNDKVVEFLEKTKDVQAVRAVVVDDVDSVWELVKNTDVRVYKNEA